MRQRQPAFPLWKFHGASAYYHHLHYSLKMKVTCHLIALLSHWHRYAIALALPCVCHFPIGFPHQLLRPLLFCVTIREAS